MINTITNQELLDKARRDYPIGTIHGGYTGSNCGYKVTNNNFKLVRGNIYSGDDNGCIYHGESRQWAKILYHCFELW